MLSRRLPIVFIVVFLGCGKRDQLDLKPVWVEDDDPKMKAAIDRARQSVGDFIAALRAPKPNQSGFSIKMPFADGSEIEHMWLTPVTYDGQSFIGTVNNQPEKVKSVALGRKVTVEPNKLSDWMYIENRKLIGGYTIRALRDRMSPDERSKLEKTLPFSFD